jgi:hypothetical protein
MGTKYNGWTNYETWALALWLSNDESMSNFLGRTLYDIEKDYDGADWLKGYCEEKFDDIFEHISNYREFWRDIMRDLFNASLSEVNWFEIAVNMRGDYNDEIDNERDEPLRDESHD